MPPRTPFADVSNNDSTVDPTISDDGLAGWDVGSRWINTSTGKVWFCTNNSAGAAVWKDVSATTAAGTHPVTISGTDPTVTDDANSGHDVGDHWINTSANRVFQAISVTIGAAVWERIDQPKSNIDTSDPTSAADNTQGYEIGSWWVNTQNDSIWFAVDVSTGAAVWRRSDNRPHPVTVSASDPTVNSDSSAGYAVGDHWVNSSTQRIYQATSVAIGAAVWERIDQPRNNVVAGAPTVSNDNTQGYEAGSWWIDTATGWIYHAISVSTGAADWRRATNVKGNATGSDPVVGNDGTQGYEIGSVWINTTTDQAFVALDVSTGAAVWKRTTNRKVTVSASLPTVNDDSSLGYEIGSWWITTATQSRLYRAIDVSVGAAVWKRETNYQDNVTAITDPSVTNDDTQGYEPGSVWINTVTNEVFAATSTVTGAAKWVTTVGVTGSPAVNPGEVMYGTLLDYPSAGNVASSTVFYIRLKLGAGLVLFGMRTFIDSGGTGGRSLRMGLYNQLVPADFNSFPYTKLAETTEIATNGLNGDFTTLPFIAGNYTIPVTGYYWLAIISDSTSLKFAVTAPVRANFLPKREETSTGTVLPAVAGTLTNPVGSVIYMAGIEA